MLQPKVSATPREVDHVDEQYQDMIARHTPCWYIVVDEDLLFDVDPDVLASRVLTAHPGVPPLLQYIAHPPPYRLHILPQ